MSSENKLPPPDSIRESLVFARQMAKEEIEAIERLHKRTLFALGIPLAGLSLLLGLAGWVGYINLQKLTIQTTTIVVQKRLQDELTQKNIDTAVQTALRDHAREQIDEAVRKQVEFNIRQQFARLEPQIKQETAVLTREAVEKLHPEIEGIAQQEVKTFLHKQHVPRTLTPQQVKDLVRTAAQLGVPANAVDIGVGTDSESYQFAEQIEKALRSAGWNAGVAMETMSGLDSPYGLYILTNDPNHPTEAAQKLERCLRAAGQNVKFGRIEGKVETVYLYVQPKGF